MSDPFAFRDAPPQRPTKPADPVKPPRPPDLPQMANELEVLASIIKALDTLPLARRKRAVAALKALLA